MGIWSLNKRGEDVATSNTLVAILTIIVIAVVLFVVFAFKDQLVKETSPLLQDFDEALEVAKIAADPKTAEDENLLKTFDVFKSDFDSCILSLPDDDCGCFIQTLEIPEGAFFVVRNKEDRLILSPFTGDDVPIKKEEYTKTKIGLLHYDEKSKELQCLYPEYFFIKKSPDNSNPFDITISNWAITFDGEAYFDVVSKVYFENSEVEPFIQDQFAVAAPDGLGQIVVTYFDYSRIYFKFEEGIWKFKTSDEGNLPLTERYHTLSGLYSGSKLKGMLLPIYQYLYTLNEGQGLIFLDNLREKRNEIIVDGGLPPMSGYTIPSLIKFDNFNYCLITELTAYRSELPEIEYIENPQVIEGSNIYYMWDHPYFYITEREYCTN